MTSAKKFLRIRCYKDVLVIKSVKISAGWTLIFERDSNSTDLLSQKNSKKHTSFNANLPWMACGFVCMEYAMWAFQKPALPRYSETWDLEIVLLLLKTFPAIDDMSLKHAAYLETGHAYGLITESSDTTVFVRGRNDSPTWRVFFLHLFYFNWNNWQRVPEQMFTIIFGKIPKPL